MKIRTPLKKFSIFLPLLGCYLILIFLFSSDALSGDENRYIGYAKQLTEGYFTNVDNPNLRNGPGYPLVLLPFVAMDLPIVVPRLLNALFVFAGLLYFFRTIQHYTNKKLAVIFTFIMGLYPPLLRWMLLLYTEALSFFLICGFIYHVCSVFRKKDLSWRHTIFAALFLCSLILTKVIFFNVLVVGAFLSIVLLVKRPLQGKRALLVLACGFVFVLPYLLYAYSITGKMFYLSTGGGEILYHRASPYEGEWGNWFSKYVILDPTERDTASSAYNDLSNLSQNHKDFYLELEPLTHIERDSVLKAKAIANMKAHPGKYLKNTVSNVGRFLFNYPVSYRSQNLNAYGYLIPNMFIVVAFIFMLYPAIVRKRAIPFEIIAQLSFIMIYGGGMILLGGKGRYFVIMVPGLLLFIAVVWAKTLQLKLVKKS